MYLWRRPIRLRYFNGADKLTINVGVKGGMLTILKVQISDITWRNITGTSRYNVASSIHCSNEVPCPGLKFDNVNITSLNASMGLPSPEMLYLCANIVDQNSTGINATNIPCNGFDPNDFPQQLTSNYQVFSNGSVEPIYS